jgi:copper chaperone CopZ
MGAVLARIAKQNEYGRVEMNRVSYTVPNISCGHCVATIERELSELQGVSKVEASNGDKQVAVEFGEPTTEADIVSLLTEINYPPAA